MIFSKPANKNFPAIFLLIMIISLGFFHPATAKESNKILVFAAASTTNAVDEIGQLFSQKEYGRFVPSFASSSTLAKQIASGAPANVYISANPKWMTFLDDKHLIEKGTRRDLLGNRIVLIAPAASNIKIDIHPGFDLLPIIGTEKLAMGDPDHVPAGIYGKQALMNLGVWDKIAPKVVRAKDVRTALVFVERQEVPLGIVYATDAAITDKVKVAGIFPENSHPPVTYQAAIVKGNDTKTARAFYNFMESSEAKAIFNKYGFFVK
ncbi:molybdate ABC transporter substrate-binding protein [Desulfobacula phenolica]|uniref:Molybdate transport system substrate-binding protein n=1 Tax=Desulfobacula phenolica TaxID=90732 RepID=A0A1H2J1J0_9BACT|nr:molybdate ABC transporter substrate-binding protein [Desulfobacula phenolica]SDU50016.1 molybdate transport system substrate-binding protein [Desulfobacula phenolica]